MKKQNEFNNGAYYVYGKICEWIVQKKRTEQSEEKKRMLFELWIDIWEGEV